ncbi:MAG: DUF2336 domain-containing protein, partial [Rhodospirillaceae bacterium]|nr:DUF2336 domain-containing protein [Rhodospirillaceae bacterium]
ASEIWVLDKLALREDLIAEIVVELTTLVSAAARKKLAATYNLQEFTDPLVAEAEISAVLQTIKKVSTKGLISLAETLQTDGRLKPYLLLAALRERQLGFLEAALSVMTRRSLEHVRSVIDRANLDPVKDLLKTARIPDLMYDDFWKEIKTSRQKRNF